MKPRGVHLQYSFGSADQRGAEVDHPLFELLSALAEHGSIRHAAAAVGASYRHVWGALKHWEAALGEPLVAWAQGQPATLTPFAERLLWAERRARSRLAPHIEALRAELEHVLADALDGTQRLLSMHASHDLALPLLRELAATQRLHIGLKFAGSVDALRALQLGRCVVAGFHAPPLPDADNPFGEALHKLLVPGRHKLIGCTTRAQGLLVARGNPLGLRTLADVAARGARFVNRQPGSGTRLLIEHLLAQGGIARERIVGYGSAAEDSHLAVAAAVAGGTADAALGIAAAAAAFDLGFVPLVDEDYYLVCLARSLELPEVRALREVLRSEQWARVLATLAGYAPSRAGEVLSLTRALPWWHFKRPRRRRRAAAEGR